MRLVIEVAPDGTLRLQASGLRDRAEALDLVEMARQAIHQQGARERAAQIQPASGELLKSLKVPY